LHDVFPNRQFLGDDLPCDNFIVAAQSRLKQRDSCCMRAAFEMLRPTNESAGPHNSLSFGFRGGYVFISCLVLALAVQAYFLVKMKVGPAIRSDGWGYYLYLPALFIYHDLHFSFLKSASLPSEVARYRAADGTWQGLSNDGGTGYRDKYALGPAVMQTPFFLGALAFAKLKRRAVNGFETPFQVANVFAGAFYFALGTWLIYRTTLRRYGQFASIAAILFAILATNLLFYATFDGSYSHVYGYCLVAGVLYLTISTEDAGVPPRLGSYFLFGLLMGLAVMVRPTNAVVAPLYLIFIRRANVREIVTGSLAGFAASALAALPQMLVWLVTSGSLIYWSYVGEGFTFPPSDVLAYVTTLPKGIFFWHPAYFFMIASVVAQLPVRRFETLVLMAIIALNIYVGASWGDNGFGQTFGCRQIVEMIPLMLPSVAATAGWSIKGAARRRIAAGLMAVLGIVNTIQFYGYAIGTLPHNRATLASYRAFWVNPFGRQ
jgi:hypothetical protein